MPDLPAAEAPPVEGLAFWRDAENRWLVLVGNVLFGASGLGWFFALYLATRKPKEPRGTRAGDPGAARNPEPV
ncbi:superinfection immunity protein [Streptomyces flavofungini]|uniref:superinfection immunity protein n=1 Tax=Streptomyces flavofungini TaxID=68200 RepID=UPI0025B0DF22|nr:superinfection immunity protein [Streptomyces flavofungini]WJV48695.1 superinfection immunity protein [Streptomyces flavofungini]